MPGKYSRVRTNAPYMPSDRNIPIGEINDLLDALTPDARARLDSLAALMLANVRAWADKRGTKNFVTLAGCRETIARLVDLSCGDILT